MHFIWSIGFKFGMLVGQVLVKQIALQPHVQLHQELQGGQGDTEVLLLGADDLLQVHDSIQFNLFIRTSRLQHAL